MNSLPEPRTRRGFLVGGLAALTGCSAAGSPESDEATTAESWPYWTDDWTVEHFDASGGIRQIRAEVRLTNEREDDRVWTGVLWAGGLPGNDYPGYYYREKSMPFRVEAGSTKAAANHFRAYPGSYEVGILGVDRYKTTVEVDADE